MARLFVLISFVALSALAEPPTGEYHHGEDDLAKPEGAAPELLEDERARPKDPDYGSSWVPIVGYNPIYEFFFGGGFFYKQPTFAFGIHGVLTLENVYQVMTHWTQKVYGPWSYGLDFEYSKGFEPYYGEGGETRAVDEVKIWGDKILARPRIGYTVNPSFETGLFLDVRSRSEERIDGRPGRLFPNETTIGYGFYADVDMRDEPANPTEGYTLGAELAYLPASFSTIPDAVGSAQISANFAIYKEMLAGVIAAVKLAAGASVGEPSYLFKFRLGGTDLLRGYFDNRFRGKKFYLQQTEVRFPIWGIFGGATFLGFGDATDNEFTAAKLAYGVGLRIGLPPDFINQMRIDFGFGRDQSGVFVDFGHAF